MCDSVLLRCLLVGTAQRADSTVAVWPPIFYALEAAVRTDVLAPVSLRQAAG